MRVLAVLGLLLAYTTFKVMQLWPGFAVTAILITVLLFALMLAGTFISRSNARVFETFWFHVLAWTGSLTMGAWATFIMISIPIDLVNLFLVSGTLPHAWPLWTLGFSLVLALIGYLTVLKGPKVVEVTAGVAQLPAELSGLKLVQLSDLHVGPTVRKSYVEKMVKRAMRLEPDFIFLTGDFADAQASAITEHMEPLRNLRAKYGVYYVTGNHEYYWGAEGLIDKMRELGFTPLINENRAVSVGATKVLIAGVPDPVGGHMVKGHQPDVAKALKSSEETVLKILLAHRPDAYLEAEPLGFDLQFSGHTHSGQFFPFSLLIGFAHKYYRGLHKHGNLWLYVNPGTGYWGPANRFGVRAEITMLKLGNLEL